MNAGMTTLAARGEMPDFVAILDADFVALPNFMSHCLALFQDPAVGDRSEEHTSELQSLMRISYAVFCLKKKKTTTRTKDTIKKLNYIYTITSRHTTNKTNKHNT